MATNDQNDFPINTDPASKRTSSEFLPKYFRTLPNKKFLAATMDQMIQTGVAEKLNAYYGRRNSKAATVDDSYIPDVSNQRENYQFESATVVKDELDNIEFYKDYVDLVNQINNYAGNTLNHSRNFAQESYSWNPHINWDKFVNFREYYWMPFGPQVIDIFGQSKEVESTYTVTLAEEEEEAYIFSPDGLTRNPTLTLYRGQTYRFEINSPGHPIAFSTNRQFTPPQTIVTASRDGIRASGDFDVKLYDVDTYDYGDFYIVPPRDQSVENIDSENVSNLFELGVRAISDDGEAAVYIEKGTIEFTIPIDAPDVLYYVSKNDIDLSGLVKVKDIEENTAIDIDKEVLGKKTYKSANGVNLINGMRVKFGGEVTPETFADSIYYVEGVGDKIKLVDEKDLEVFTSADSDIAVPFDTYAFDRIPFSQANGYIANKDYIVSNRSSIDKNQWARSNKWIHRQVIEQAALVNQLEPEFDENTRAKRPIIEFEANLRLAKFGTHTKQSVDLVDMFTDDVFSIIEGSSGYNIDGIDLVNGMRILVTQDTDPLANNKIYEVKFITFNNNRQITLVETEDTTPILDEVVYVRNGTTLRGKMYYFDGESWHQAQDKTAVNQPIIFDVFDEQGTSIYDYSGIVNPGTTLFSYSQGTGSIDTELGFALNYRVVENSGDILFNFNLLNDVFEYQENNELKTIPAEQFRLKKYSTSTAFVYESGWKISAEKSYQNVIRLYDTKLQLNNFEIDVYNNASSLLDLKTKVYLNSKIQKEGIDYEIYSQDEKLFVLFANDLNNQSIVEIKCKSKAQKNNNGYYEVPTNLERNPLNNNPTSFTFGEVSDHVSTIVEELQNFTGAFPGNSNLDNLGYVTPFGRKFLQHSGPVNLAMYHLLDKDANIINAIELSQREYSQFKRELIQVITTSDYDGNPAEFLDDAIERINKDKTNTLPFYFSDMIGSGDFGKYHYTVVDPQNKFYALPEIFNLKDISNQAVYVYKNGQQLIFEKEYYFTDEGFVYITIELSQDDILDIHYYENTDGCFIPSTPTKLGLYPKYEPKIYTDTSYLTPTKVIQGHDGSITVAYNDYRDDILLELELRIFNNLKIKYDTNIFDIHQFVSGAYRKTDFTKQEIDRILIADFTKWLELVGNVDYSNIEDIFDLNNGFTFNYDSMIDANGQSLTGFWRGIYKYYFDTDTPHQTPWEMLGLTIQPDWWQTQYGPAPYTSDNLILWQDLQEGVIRNPNTKPVFKSQYARPNLLDHLPVDNRGNLIDPVTSGLATNFVGILAKRAFEFGDVSPVESAWRRSSDYVFSLIKSHVILQPCHILGVGYDRSRIIRDPAGQLVYKDTNKRIRLADIQYPNTPKELSRIQTCGLINFILDYLSKGNFNQYDIFREKIKTVSNNLGIRLAGYTDKSKFNMILDSRTPLNQGNVFVPQENFNLFLNTSTATRILTYSGVLVEKTSKGFIVRGYNKEYPVFEYYKPIERQNDPTIKIGGVSEDFIEWAENQVYIKGQLVEYNDRYYRCQEQHTSQEELNENLFIAVPEIPTVGGISAKNRKVFSNAITTINYGTIFDTIQQVVDFLLGYGAYLEAQGFEFDYFNKDFETIENWNFSVKEFLFWTTQNWGAGSIITLSPGATSLTFQTDNETTDDIFESIYNYSVVKSDGKNILKENLIINRTDNNTFSLKIRNSNEGIYGAKIPLVQKEHVVLLDNRTVFNDVIYNPEPGYRQERIRILGYRTDGWNGSFNIPGFIYDSVKLTNWTTWKDYPVGSVVKYKEFYYVALENVTGSEEFISNQWQRLAEKPESSLKGNLEYKTNQFTDFYDLDTDNFDTEQQKLAQHLIGYQKRNYLQNIINDDVSQYKFYQGFIQEKGTLNSLIKLFDALSSADQDSLDFYEEWAIKLGAYGAVDGVEIVEYEIDEAQLRLEPQPFNLVDILPSNNTDLIYNIVPANAYVKPENYTHRPFPITKNYKQYVGTAGYVNSNDVDFTFANYSDMLTLDIASLEKDAYIWIGNDLNSSWNVFRYLNSGVKVTASSINQDGSTETQGNIEIQFNKIIDLKPGEIFGVINSEGDGFFTVKSAGVNFVTIDDDTIDPASLTGGNVTIFAPHRYDQFTSLKNIAQNKYIDTTKVWIDEVNGSYQNTLNLTTNNKIVPAELVGEFLDSYSVDNVNKNFVIGQPTGGTNLNGQVNIYNRATPYTAFELVDQLTLDTVGNTNVPEICDADPRFGDAVAISPDSKYIVVGAPQASNVKTSFVGAYNTTTDYLIDNIVQYQDNYYRALVVPDKEIASRNYESFNSAKSLSDTTGDDTINWLLTGGYPLSNITVDNILVRVPKDQFDAVDLAEDPQIVLHYLDTEVPLVEPFEGTVLGIDYTFINQPHTVIEKIEAVIYVDVSYDIPTVGDILTAGDSEFEVTDVFVKNDSFSIYVKNIEGPLLSTGELFVGTFKLGDYEVVSPELSYNELGGYFKIATPSIEVRDIVADTTTKLVHVDILRNSEADNSLFYSIAESVKDAGTINTYDDYASYVGLLPGHSNNAFVVRAPAAMNPQPGDTFTLSTSPFNVKDLSDVGLQSDFIGSKSVVSVWDGWIDVQLDTPVSVVDTSLIEPLLGNTIFEIDSAGAGQIQFVVDIGQNIRRCYLLGADFLDGADFGNATRIAITDVSRSYVSQEIGFIRNSSFAGDNPAVGKLLVIYNPTAITPSNELSSFDYDYWFYNQTTEVGLGLPASIPSPSNNDWQLVSTIEADAGGVASGFTNEGFISIFERDTNGIYTKVKDLIPSDRTNNNNLEFGSNVILTKNNKLYTAFVKANNRIYILKHGTDEQNNVYNWQIAKDEKFRGLFNTNYSYLTDDIVMYDRLVGLGVEYILYKAKTNIIGAPVPDPTNTTYWEEISSDIDYTGFIPVTGNIAFDDSTVYDSSNAVIGEILTSTIDGKMLLVSSNKDGNNEVVVYNEDNGRYRSIQTLEIQKENSEYLESLAISKYGDYIAVGKFYQDNESVIDSGTVEIWKLTNGTYSLHQTLTSPSNEAGELFGYNVSFNDTNDLIVSGYKGDKIEDELFADDTYFDNNFTQFKTIFKDQGVIYNFENINDEFIFSALVPNADNYANFGKTAFYNNNHIFVLLKDTIGKVVEYRKTKDSAWEIVSKQQNVVDINKMKSCFVYDKLKGIILDYIDIIDPIQGRFAGPAEQEISYKTKYDPATYTVGTTTTNNDAKSAWGPLQVGKVWLDLSTIKFMNAYQENIQYATNNWNHLFIGSEVNAYEWVETTLLPVEWNELADTTAGLAQGISGTSKYGNEVYSERNIFDNIAQTFTKKYYYWVGNKKTVPNMENRNLSVFDVERLIEDPAGQGYKFVALISDKKFALYNCKSLFADKDSVIHFDHYTIENQDQNMHTEYQLISEGLGTSKPKDTIVEKWFDSLIGYDKNTREVPDPLLSVREKYGNLNRPRQSWFVNRLEALKEFIERTNLVLSNNLIVDEYNLSALNEKDPLPSGTTNSYDILADTEVELQFIGTKNLEQAVLEPVLEDGVIVDVRIINPGYGYKVAPSYEIVGTGEDAEIQINLDANGRISSVRIVNGGYRYETNTRITLRPFAVLVQNDGSILGKWSIYHWNRTLQRWQRAAIQDYDVTVYWDYIDWYAEGYNEFTNIKFYINNTFELPTIADKIGDVVKIKNVGTGGWLLLEKIDNQDADYDYTINYKTIGRQNGTIAISSNLYDYKDNTASFDGFSYDVDLYDNIPIKETRIIIEAVKNSLFVDELETEFNKLFFASIRYVLSEQPFVNWLFKTSFIKAKHNLGELSQKVTYQNDNLPSYEDYINEVKPFKTKIREYLSAYQKVDNTQSVVSDFDLTPTYNDVTGKIEVPRAIVLDNEIQSTLTTAYPNKHWAENNTFVVDSIELANSGNGYVTVPVITLEGGGGTGATARAYLNSGKVTSIEVTNSGNGYINAPQVIIDGSLQDGGTPASATAVIKNNKVRTVKTQIKFDRVARTNVFADLNRVQTINGFANRQTYELNWPVDLQETSIRVYVDNIEQLTQSFVFSNKDKDLGYTKQIGYITFNDTLAKDSEIRVEYTIAQSYLTATDRIEHYYNPTTGMYGKDFAQLMHGVDYGGVEVRSFDFNNITGWDSVGWYSDLWDTFDVNFEDIIIKLPAGQNTFTLDETLEDGIEYNIYIGQVGNPALRIDDPNWIPEYDQIGPLQEELEILQQDAASKKTLLISKQVAVELKTDEFNEAEAILSGLTPGSPEFIAQAAIVTQLDSEKDALEADEAVLQSDYDTAVALVNNKQAEIDLTQSIIDASPLIIQNASMVPIIGDGVTTSYTIPQRFNNDAEDKTLIIRKTTSDGTTTPDETSYDTALSGGSLNYANAKGINASEIIIDGDGFVTPLTSAGPEEHVPSQILDTLDIRVYDRIGEGAPMIVARNYELDYYTEEQAVADAQNLVNLTEAAILVETDPVILGNLESALAIYQAQLENAQNILDLANIPLDLGELPATEDSVIVKLDNKIITKENYIIDFLNKTIKVITPPPAGSVISTLTMTTNGANILDMGVFIADGSTSQFLVPAEWQDDITAFVSVNGEKFSGVRSGRAERVNLIQSDDTYASPNKVILDFETPLKENDVINYVVYASNTQSFSEVKLERFTGDGSTKTFEIQNTPFEVTPLAQNVVVISDDKLLSPGYYEKFDVDTTRRYQLDLTNYPRFSLAFTDDEAPMRVYINNQLLTYSTQYIWLNEESAIELKPSVGQEGDLLEVYIENSQYSVVDNVVTIETAPAEDAEILVYTFSNHDVLETERTESNVVLRDWYVVGDGFFNEYSLRTRGYIKLATEAHSVAYVWASINGELLIANVDYYLVDTKDAIQIVRQINDGDRIDIVHFTGTPVSTKFGYRQFKDILNRTHYKRLNKVTETELAQDLNYYDLRIEVQDGSVLSVPNKNKNIPGIIFVNGERIEYFVKEDNTLRQLRRGTLGTSVNEFIPVGTKVSEQGNEQTVPYGDKTDVINYEIDSNLTNTFTLNFPAEHGVNGFEVFLAGTRLRKNEIEQFDYNSNDPASLITLPAEFSVELDGILGQATTSTLTLNLDAQRVQQLLVEGSKLTIIRKTLTLWTPQGTALKDADTVQGIFLREATIDLPK